MTAILICVSVFYVVFSAPVAVYLVYQNSWLDNAGLVWLGKMQVYWAIASIMSYFNNSMNFFLYCMSGPRFRKELVKMFGGLRSLSLSHESSVSGLWQSKKRQSTRQETTVNCESETEVIEVEMDKTDVQEAAVWFLRTERSLPNWWTGRYVTDLRWWNCLCELFENVY